MMIDVTALSICDFSIRFGSDNDCCTVWEVSLLHNTIIQLYVIQYSIMTTLQMTAFKKIEILIHNFI